MNRVGFSLLTVLGALLISCASAEVDPNNPESLFKDAQSDIESDRYQLAQEKLRKVKNKFPYSRFSIIARLRIADVYYLQDSFIEAAAAYEVFRDLHPNHEKAEYASFRVGESYFNAAPSNIARDQSYSVKALDAFEQFERRFGTKKKPYAVQIPAKIKMVRNRLAAKELYIANWYLGQDEYRASIGRYEKILKIFPHSESAKDAKENLAEAKEGFAEEEKERLAKEAKEKKS